MNDAQEIAQNSTMAIDLPQEVQDKLDELKNARPEKKFVVIEVDQDDSEKAEEMKQKLSAYNPDDIVSVNVMKNKVDKQGNSRSFVILEVNEVTNQLSESTKQDGEIFTVVEESAMPAGGTDGLGMFLQQNLKYPTEAKKDGKEGTVFVQFVVNKDGSLTDFSVLKSADPHLDEEALRVAKLLPNWTPGKQSGKVVRQRFVLPIRFKLDANDTGNRNIEIREVKGALKVQYAVTLINGEKVVKGTVLDDNGQALRGANIVNVGTTSGTTTDNEGNFTLKVANKNGQLAASFIGYESKVIDY
jgi:TonB family protein